MSMHPHTHTPYIHPHKWTPYVHTHTHTYAHTHTYTHIHTYTHTHIHTVLTLPTGSRWFILFRVLRALLSLYCVKIINGIGVIFNTVLHTLPSVAKILMLLFITMFIFAVLGQSLFGGNCQRSFGSLGASESL